MRKIKIPKSSFLYRFIIRFIFMIILPILCSWWLYVKVLNYFYIDNTLATQQINMENSLSSLDSSLSATSNVITALGSNTEIVYYLDYYFDKPQMLYSLVKNIHSFCDNLYTMTPYLTSMRIYSDSPMLLYAEPFAKLEDIPLDKDSLKALENSNIREIIWKIDTSEDGEFPSVYGYQKLYTSNYSKSIGYAEVQLSPELFSDYFEMIANLSDDPHAVFALYQGNTLIYSTDAEPIPVIAADEPESGYDVDLFKNQYKNYLKIPQLNLCVIRSGHLSDRLILPSNNNPSVLISIVIVLLLALFIGFFMNVASLSKRILDFSSFIKHSNPDNLIPFHPESKSSGMADELDSLINAYNTMICENTSLISQVQKMELLSQDARYQALQGQIHPHFIYGTLETIRMTALQNKDKEAAAMIFSLSALIRYSISISSKAVMLRDELEIASHYLKIQKIRFDDRMDYTFDIDEKLLNLQLPSFILQPILENAIVYGISQTLDHCILKVEAHEKDALVTLSISNTGLPITHGRLEEINSLLSGNTPLESFQGTHNGLALNNIRERLTIFFHGQASIRLALQDNCTATVITIPYSEQTDFLQDNAADTSGEL